MAYRNKYSNHKVVTKDGKFDSKLEYSRYVFLQHQERIGRIYKLQKQVPFELIPQQVVTIPQFSEKTGKPIKNKVIVAEQALFYVADFTYYIVDPADPTNVSKRLPILEDTKGFRTSDYKIKRKVIRHLRHIPITEIEHPTQSIPEYSEYRNLLINTHYIDETEPIADGL